ncbi:CFC_HP_G0089510.mRNA.1.CDS.1 [Saccharomyces cerevisiae]|nr:CFC_HP_G0089510.mRNA.1.CDS.1 [Saccharomyces cerevisiae]CAI6839096.1 CFC_HP_G0089510.mRNA.1.CDS.1 [Saccharomyces cerevisiae]
MEDELDMKPGDKIKVITDDEEYKDGWYFGRNLRTNEEGLYPVVFTQKITVEKAPTLMRAKSTKRQCTTEFKDDSIGPPDRFTNSGRDEEEHSITHETILSATDGLDVVESTVSQQPRVVLLGSERRFGKSSYLINGIDTTKLNPVEAEFWSPEEITAYFIMEGYDVQSASRFQKHKISGKILLELELVHLKRVGHKFFLGQDLRFSKK